MTKNARIEQRERNPKGSEMMKSLVGPAIWASLASAILLVLSPPAAAQSRMYIPLGSANEIVVIDTDRDAVVGKIQGVPAIHGLAGTPDGRYLIAGSFEEREAGGSPPPKPSGMSEADHAAHHRPKAADARKAQATVSTVSVIRLSDKTIIRQIDVPGAVHHVAVSPDGRYAAVTHPSADGISVIDLGTYRVATTIKTGALPNYAVFSQDGGLLYVTNAGDGTIAVVPTARWAVQRTIRVGASPEHLIMRKDGQTLYVNNVDGGTVSVISLRQNAVVRTIPAGKNLHGIDISDDGKTLFVSARDENKLVAIDLVTAASRTSTLNPAPYHLAAVRGTGKLYVSSADAPKIWVVDQKTLAVRHEIEIGGKGHQMVQTPGR